MTTHSIPEKIKQVKKIACLGEVMIELITSGGTDARLGVAGDSYNTAAYLKRLGTAQVSYITALGDDSFSARILADMARHGIDDVCVERRAGRMCGLYAIETDGRGERSFSYWRDSAAVRSLFQTPCSVAPNCLMDFDLLFLSGISIAVLPPDTRAVLLAQIDAFRAGGGLLAFDSNYRPRLWADVATAKKTTADFWARADIALPSLDDEMALFGQSEAQVAARFTDAGLNFGAMKRGELGPRGLGQGLAGEDAGLTFPPAPKVVDTTAAGDSFNAAFLASLIKGESLSDALLAGHTLAMQVVQKAGAIV